MTRDPEILRAVADALRARVADAADTNATRTALQIVTGEIGADEGEDAHDR